MSHRICLWLLIISSTIGSAKAAERLEWKLSTGDALTYAIQNEMVMTANVGGFDNTSRITQTMHMDWDVQTLTANRDYILSQIIKRIRVEMAPNTETSIVFDSGSPETPDDAMAKSLANVFRKLVNRKFMITMAPTGSIEDVEIPADLLESLKAAATGSPTNLDEKQLKQILSQTAVILPKNAVSKGDQWQSEQNIDFGFATLRMDARMTYQGLDKKGMAVIGYVPVVSLEPKADSPMKITLKDSQGAGRILFDPDRGRVVRMQLTLHMEMQTAVRGQQVVQKIDQKTMMVLQE